MKTAAALLAATMCLSTTPAFAKGASSHFHIDVQDASDGTRVQINVPLSLARVALKCSGQSKLKIDGSDVNLTDLRALWKELKDADSDATVKAVDKENDVSMVAHKGQVDITVKEKNGGKDTVFIHIPADAIDALFSGTDEDELNLGAAIAQLQSTYKGDLITVDDKDSHVHIWLD